MKCLKACIFYQGNHQKPVKYIIETMLSMLGITCRFISSDINEIKDDEFLVTYGPTAPKTTRRHHLHVNQSSFFDKNYKTREAMPKEPLSHLLRGEISPDINDNGLFLRNKSIPIIFWANKHSHENSLYWEHGSLNIEADIFASAFYVLSRYEELFNSRFDQDDRFLAIDSLATRENFIDRPIVDEYCEILLAMISNIYPGEQYSRFRAWPKGKFAISLSHDVDQLYKYKYNIMRTLKYRLVPLIKKGNIQSATNLISDMILIGTKLRKDAFGSLESVRAIERQYDLISTFFFLAPEGHNRNLSHSINLTDKRYGKIKNSIKSLEKESCEIAFHPGIATSDNPDQFIWEKNRIQMFTDSSLSGVRQHGLRWKTPITWRIHEKFKLIYDSSMTFADNIGFRCGTCYPFMPYDIELNRVINIWELPLNVMDVSLSDYMKLNPDEGILKITELIDTVKHHGGVFSLLWHHSFEDNTRRPKWLNMYRNIVEQISRNDCWITTGEQLIRYWKKPKN